MNFQFRSFIVGILLFSLSSCALEKQSDSIRIQQPQLFIDPYAFSSPDAVHDESLVLPAGPVQSTPRLIKRGRNWTGEEEEHLLQLRDDQDMSWAELTEQFEGRSWRSLTSKYYKLKQDPSAPTKKRAKLWTPEEKQRILKLREAGTPESWEEVAKLFPGRTAMAVEAYYYLITRKERPVPASTLAFFSAEEDELLLELKDIVMSWKERNKHFKNRSLNSLKKRYRRLTEDRVRNKRWTDEDDNLLKEAVEAGFTRKEISQLLERSAPAVDSRVRKLISSGLIDVSQRTPGSRHRYTADDVQLMHEMRGRGMSWKDIATERYCYESFSRTICSSAKA